MKITKKQLKQIIKEEIKRILEQEEYLHPESSEHEGILLPICKDKVLELAELARTFAAALHRALPDEAIAEIDDVGSGSHAIKMKIAQKWLAADPQRLYPGDKIKQTALDEAHAAWLKYTRFKNESYDQSVGWPPDLPMDKMPAQPPQQICRDYLQQGKIENPREEDLYPLARLFHR